MMLMVLQMITIINRICFLFLRVRRFVHYVCFLAFLVIKNEFFDAKVCGFSVFRVLVLSFLSKLYKSRLYVRYCALS